MSFTVIDVTSPADRLRGTLQRRLLEVRAGLFVGVLPQRVRDQIWKLILEGYVCQQAIMLYPGNNEAGFLLRTYGEGRRVPVENYGILLVNYKKHFKPAEQV